ncbi:MAG: serine dehydratase [Nostocales cyanobacterium]|nr:MAG: serine dehydratase [Nostocales cyanobacterium]
MQLLTQDFTQNSTRIYTEVYNHEEDNSSIYTLENLIQTLEEVANYLTDE